MNLDIDNALPLSLTAGRRELIPYPQVWKLLALVIPLFLPHPRMLWLLKAHLHRHADDKYEDDAIVKRDGASISLFVQVRDRSVRDVLSTSAGAAGVVRRARVASFEDRNGVHTAAESVSSLAAV